MALQSWQLPLASSLSSSSSPSSSLPSLSSVDTHSFLLYHHQCSPSSRTKLGGLFPNRSTSYSSWRRRKTTGFLVGRENFELRVQDEELEEEEEEEEEGPPPSPQDLQYIQEVKRVVDLLKKNRDMLFNEVKLTIMIEDPREVERRRLLGIEDLDSPTRDDLAEALEQVNEGKVPKNRLALKMLAEEMMNWPNLEVEAPKERPKKSLYAKATDTGIDPKEAAKRLKIDWDSAADIEDVENSDDADVPPAVGYGALYLVTAFPVIIGISVVLILFYNSLR
ncbi:ycf3-interacting protein 1, chloroplastic [Manihot esculenta]|uniref:Ycf3-interacting protein 1, chloroplastic n=1 Tax=Manihot esculenta TaxID=3983 RepID=A0A2C9W7X8_MANES|nr:ycf3-interacting protein 1, chloroplastic [Manihot esculenta]OAY54417.1 hypothetical protein MANES_03G073000v8 [Manihot esculenta]